MPRSTIALLMLLSMVGTASAKKPKLQWDTGTLVGVEMQRGNRVESSTNAYTGQTDIDSQRDDVTLYKIVFGEFVYVAKRTLRRNRDRQLHLTTNGPVKFAISGDDFYVLDEYGKEHKLELQEKIANRQPK